MSNYIVWKSKVVFFSFSGRRFQIGHSLLKQRTIDTFYSYAKYSGKNKLCRANTSLIHTRPSTSKQWPKFSKNNYLYSDFFVLYTSVMGKIIFSERLILIFAEKEYKLLNSSHFFVWVGAPFLWFGCCNNVNPSEGTWQSFLAIRPSNQIAFIFWKIW